MNNSNSKYVNQKQITWDAREQRLVLTNTACLRVKEMEKNGVSKNYSTSSPVSLELKFPWTNMPFTCVIMNMNETSLGKTSSSYCTLTYQISVHSK